MTKRSASGEFYSASSAPDAEIMDEPATATAEEWRKELEISEAQLAAGDVVESAEVLRELDKTIARIKAKKATAPQR
jgi:RNA polymerase-interacting CarD/CdnL/TRCF family regulator